MNDLNQKIAGELLTHAWGCMKGIPQSGLVDANALPELKTAVRNLNLLIELLESDMDKGPVKTTMDDALASAPPGIVISKEEAERNLDHFRELAESSEVATRLTGENEMEWLTSVGRMILDKARYDRIMKGPDGIVYRVWNGGDQPAETRGKRVKVILRYSPQLAGEDQADDLRWQHVPTGSQCPSGSDIIGYRVL